MIIISVLVICEKTAQARALKEGLKKSFKTITYKNKFNKTKIPNLYYVSDDVTIVCARGHLLELYDVKDYLGIESNSWSELKNYLPFVPDNFKYKPKQGGWEKGQLELICRLINSKKFDTIYNFGDPDAEGELLIREILSYAKNTAEVKRMESKSLVPDVVADAFYHPVSERGYNDLYFEALARQQKDWLNGINLTTMISLATHKKLNMGRVIVPITRFVYDSDKAIENFVPTSTYGINAIIDGISVPLKDISFSIEQKSSADKLADELKANPTAVKNVEKKDRTLHPKRLYSTSKLLADLNTIYKIPMKNGADAMEKLYLNAYITYPRTDCEYLQTKEQSQMQRTVNAYKDKGYDIEFHTKSTVFNDKKCGGAGEGGHTAVVITDKIPTESDIEKFTKAESAVYDLVKQRTLSNFAKDAVVEDTKVVLTNSDREFSISGTRIKDELFLAIEKRKLQNALDNDYKIGDVVPAEFNVVKRTTKAPPKANSARLLYYLEHPFEKEIKSSGDDETDDFYEKAKEGATIGTGDTMEATTTKAIEYGYFTENKSGYTITTLGKQLIETLDNAGIDTLNADKTIEMNIVIKKVAKKIMTLEDSKQQIKDELLEAKEKIEAIPVLADDGEIIGTCPECGSPIVETPKTFKCTSCSYVLFKSDKWLAAMSKKLTKKMAIDLITRGETKVKGLKSKRSGNKFNAILTREKQDNGYYDWKIKGFF